jgi:hypothetical protein
MRNPGIPNFKSQITNKFQYPITEKYGPAITQLFEIFDFRPWDLFGNWCLPFIPHSEFHISLFGKGGIVMAMITVSRQLGGLGMNSGGASFRDSGNGSTRRQFPE